MKNLISVLTLLLATSSALAGNGSCGNDRSLICSSRYLLKDQTVVAGPATEVDTKDVEKDATKPSQCRATVVFYTAVGKFVAVYDQNKSTLDASIDFDGTHTVLAQSGATVGLHQAVNYSVPSELKGDVAIGEFSCKLGFD